MENHVENVNNSLLKTILGLHYVNDKSMRELEKSRKGEKARGIWEKTVGKRRTIFSEVRQNIQK